MTVATTPCQWGSCAQPADYTLEAHWTVTDYELVYVCLVHVAAMFGYLENKRVEDLAPVIYQHPLDP
jgi:hypothetical protein